MWTATLIELGKRSGNEGQQVFTILYTDGVSLKVQRDYARLDFSKAILEQVARDGVATFEARPPVVDLTGIALGPINTTPVPPVDPPPPTQEQKDLNAFLTLYRSAKSHDFGIHFGLIDPAEKLVTDTLAQLAAAYKPEYAELMS